MIEFNVSIQEFKNALNLANIATGDSKNSIESHSLFELDETTLKILATNKSSCFSRTILTVEGTGTGSFTADPIRLLNLIKMSNNDSIRIIYHPETTTLEIYASEEADSFISLSSLDVTMFPPLDDNFDKAFEVKTVDAGLFLKGLKYAEGFLSTSKATKYSNAFIINGLVYGTDGNKQAGSYTCPEFDGLEDMAIAGAAIPQISNVITKLNLMDITIKTTSTAIVLFSGNHAFGFTKVQVPTPQLPPTVQSPTTGGWVLEKSTLLKKIKRLQVAGESGLGVELSFAPGKLDLITKVERPSRESMPCAGEGEPVIASVDCWMFEKIINLFDGTQITLHPGKNRVNIFTNGTINIQEGDGEVPVPFACTALMSASV